MESATAEVRRAREHSADASGQAACLPNWSQRYLQLSSGVYVGSFQALDITGLIIYQENSKQALHQFGLSAPAAIILAFCRTRPTAISPVSRWAAATCCMSAWVPSSTIVRPPKRFLGLSIDAALVESMLNHFELSRIRKFAASLGQDQQIALKHLLSSSLECTDTGRGAPGRAVGIDPVHLRSGDGRGQEGPWLYSGAQGQAAERARLVQCATCQPAHPAVRLLVGIQHQAGASPSRGEAQLGAPGAKPPAACKLQVQTLASYWGFWHLSHFADEYKTKFGELPSETLRRGRLRTGLI